MPPTARAAAEPVRLRLIAYAYEVRATDVILEDGDRRELRQPPDPGTEKEHVRLTFMDGSSREYPGSQILDVERDRTLMPGFEFVDPPESTEGEPNP